MAKNQVMAIKHAKARKEAVKQMTEDANLTSCATRLVRQSKSVIWNLRYKPYSICNN